MSKRRKLLRFSLGSMLFCFTAFAIVLGFWSNGAWHQKVAVTALERTGARVDYETHPLEKHEHQKQQLAQLPKIIRDQIGSFPTPPNMTAAEKWRVWRRKQVRQYLGKHFIDKPSSLQYAQSDRDRPTTMEWKSIQSIDSIRVVSVGPYANDEDIANICRIPGIESLTISSANITENGLQHLSRLNKLTTLEIVPFPVGARVAELNLPPSLNSISLDYEVLLDDDDVVALAMRGQPVLIQGVKFNVSDEGLRHLAELEISGELALRHNHRITDDGMKWIAKMNAVKFDFEDTKITDRGLRYLEELPNLEFLNLVGTNVSAKGVNRIKERHPAAVIWHSDGHPR